MIAMRRFIYLVLIVLLLAIVSEINARNRILRLKSGRVEILNENGSYVGSIGGGNVVAADFNNEQTMVLLTLSNGKVELRKSSGSLVRTYNVNAIDARWHKNEEVLIYKANGKIERRKLNGTLIRVL